VFSMYVAKLLVPPVHELSGFFVVVETKVKLLVDRSYLTSYSQCDEDPLMISREGYKRPSMADRYHISSTVVYSYRQKAPAYLPAA